VAGGQLDRFGVPTRLLSIMTEHVANIGERGARRRRRGGIAWLALSAVAFAALLAAGTPRWYRLVLVLPLALAATGFLQAREKT
jgi:hypothetical protein